MNRALLIATYFGPWPQWMALFCKSCANNPSFDWLILGDQEAPPPEKPVNVKWERVSYRAFIERFTQTLEIELPQCVPFKLGDLRPTLGHVLQEYVKDYEFWGHCDVDLFFGRMKHFLTDALLDRADIVSPHGHVAGHFTLFRNNDRMRFLYREDPLWSKYLISPMRISFDEKFNAFHPLVKRKKIRYRHIEDLCAWRVRPEFNRNVLIWAASENVTQEELESYPDAYFWRDGAIFDSLGKEYMYLHFMVWKGGVWGKVWGGGQWEKLSQFVDTDSTADSWKIDQSGIRKYELGHAHVLRSISQGPREKQIRPPHSSQ